MERVLVKYRSYLNAHLPMEDLQVVRIDLSEIEHARITKQTVKEPDRNGTATAFYRYLDISVNADCGELGEAPVFERKVKEPLKNHFGAVASKVQYYPVSVVDERIVRIEWRGKSHVKPPLKRAIEVLQRNNVRVEEMNKEKLDLTVRGREEKAELEDKILALAMKGNKIAAVRAARRAFGMNVIEARAFVDGLLE